MKNRIRAHPWYAALLLGLLLSLVAVGTALAGNIDPANKWAWGTNAGWINFAPGYDGVTVYPDHLEGYAWGENIGWIRLGTYTGGGSHTYANDAAGTYGVNQDGAGNLSGYAWGTNVGWINFDPDGAERVTIDPATGEFQGYAWGENIGWIKFKGTGVVAYGVVVLPADGLPGVPEIWLSAASDGSFELNWGPTVNSVRYEVCLSTTDPYFTPGASCPDTTNTSYPISLLPNVNTYYYVVRGINSVDQKSALSNRVGLFRFTLVPGS